VSVAGRPVIAATYNGSYVPPTLRVRPGDTLRLRLVNGLDDETNLHTHGCPSRRSAGRTTCSCTWRPDARRITRSSSVDARARLVLYHPHAHGHSDEQVRNGMSGALIVEGLLDPFPDLRDVSEHVLLLKDAQVGDGASCIAASATTSSVRERDAQSHDTLHPGETQLWRIGMSERTCTTAHARWTPLLRGGARWLSPRRLVPKRQLLVEPERERKCSCRLPVPEPMRSGPLSSTRAPRQPLPGRGARDLARRGGRGHADHTPREAAPGRRSAGAVTGRRTIVFSESETGTRSSSTAGRSTPAVRYARHARAVEEWTVRNESGELHDFHIHQTHFQVTEVNGVPQPFDAMGHCQRARARCGKLIIPFTDPVIVGRFVYHCHLLSHEDKA